jgi:hypothetical protein
LRSDSISKGKLIITVCFVPISKRNIAFYSSFAVCKRKIIQHCSRKPYRIQQRSRKLYRIGKKERNIRFFLNEIKKLIVFDHKKRNVDITRLQTSQCFVNPVYVQCSLTATPHVCVHEDNTFPLDSICTVAFPFHILVYTDSFTKSVQ